MTHLSDIEIANSVSPRPIEDIAASVGLKPQNLFRYGHHIAKVDLASLPKEASKPGKLVLVTAITPTPAGEGKTTTSVGLADALTPNTNEAIFLGPGHLFFSHKA